MLQTLERTHTFDARVLTADNAAALRTLTGPGGLPLLPCLHPALEEGQIVGDYAGQNELQAAAALLPLYAEDPLPTSLRAAGYGADGQGAVLTPPVLNEDYTQLRHFLLFRARRSPFFVSVCPAQSGKQSRTEVIGRDLCQKQQNAHLCAAQQGLSHRQDDKGRSGTDAGREKPVRFFRCHLTGAHRLGRSVSGRGKAAQESHQQHPGRAGSIHSHQPCHRPKWQGQHIPQRALDEQCRHHKKRIQREQQRTAAEGQSLPQCLRAGFWCRKRECPDQNQHQGYQPGKVLGLIHTHTLRFHIYVAPGAALHSGREGADVARKRRQHISPAGWFQRLFRQPPANFYGRTSVYLSGSILEIEHFRRIRSYDDGELCLELGKGLLTIYGSQLKIIALSTQRITLRGEILRTEFSRVATSR